MFNSFIGAVVSFLLFSSEGFSQSSGGSGSGGGGSITGYKYLRIDCAEEQLTDINFKPCSTYPCTTVQIGCYLPTKKGEETESWEYPSCRSSS